MAKEYNKIPQVQREIGAREDTVEEVADVKLQKVVSVPAKKVKKGLVERAVVAIIGPDGIPRVSKQVMSEIVGPSIRNLAFDAISNGLRMLILKDDYSRTDYTQGRPYQGGWGNQQTNYRSAYRGSRSSFASGTRKEEEPRVHAALEPGQAQALTHGAIILDYNLESREDAQRVLNALRDNCYQYGKVKVANYYELIGVPTVYTDNNFGWLWDDIEHVFIRPARGGFTLQFPPISAM